MQKIPLSLFDFDLPQNLIAQHPLDNKENAKMLVVQNTTFYNKTVKDIIEFLEPNDILILNNTKVIPARIKGKKDNATIELTLHYKLQDTVWLTFIRNSKRLKVGDIITFSDDFAAIVEQKLLYGETQVKFFNPNESLLDNSSDNLDIQESNLSLEEFWEKLDKYGYMPLPPYIKRDGDNKIEIDQDKITYQTVFAKEKGAVAAPTAGLHFSEDLLQKIKNKGCNIAYVTLHVGAGTFLPVKVENVLDHKMHKEYAILPQSTVEAINTAKEKGGRVIAVGTTSLRTLEYVHKTFGSLQDFAGEVDLFIVPGYNFGAVDILITNFHLPKSTLFMLVASFCGLENMKKAYFYAIENNYRFFSYGDCCFLYKQ